MRVIKEFAISSAIKATFFSWNSKYIVKLESGNLEQVYKVAETEIGGLEALEAWVFSPEFMAGVQKQFESMDALTDQLFD
jgi:hypothetical protein